MISDAVVSGGRDKKTIRTSKKGRLRPDKTKTNKLKWPRKSVTVRTVVGVLKKVTKLLNKISCRGARGTFPAFTGRKEGWGATQYPLSPEKKCRWEPLGLKRGKAGGDVQSIEKERRGPNLTIWD